LGYCVAQRPGAEPEGAAALVADGEHEAVAKAIPRLATAGRMSKAGVDDLVDLDRPSGGEVSHQGVATRSPGRGKAGAERANGRLIEPALAEQVAPGGARLGRPEDVLVVRLRPRVQLQRALALQTGAAAAAPRRFLELDTGAIRQELERLAEVDVFDALDEGEDVPAFRAAVAVPRLPGLADH